MGHFSPEKGTFSLYKKSVREGEGGRGGGAHVPIANPPPPASRPLYVCTGETQENRRLYLLNQNGCFQVLKIDALKIVIKYVSIDAGEKLPIQELLCHPNPIHKRVTRRISFSTNQRVCLHFCSKPNQNA